MYKWSDPATSTGGVYRDLKVNLCFPCCVGTPTQNHCNVNSVVLYWAWEKYVDLC